MYRRPSAASSPASNVLSLQPLSILGSPNFVSLNGRLPVTRTVSSLSDVEQPQTNVATDLEADEIFTQHSVSEVKNIQRRLRADADAKQEELRLMVGERYRDLLQASTSIISIAQSSEHVLDALDEMKQIISSQEIPRTPKGTSAQSKNDSNLQTFQSLAAHMKLLLDAPEHLWRLIERKEYFRGAWLFLLCRVVHRALMQDDVEEDRNWQVQGISVVDQFPLVQRQWESVAQFRPQITHKATLSLREPSASPEHTCATLLTLYLLDSRPLPETLSIFLAQRSRTLSSLLSKPTDSATAPSFRVNITKPNGNPVRQNSLKEPKKFTYKEVQHSVESSLDVISRTIITSRAIFQHQPGSDLSLMTRVLAQIQADANVPAINELPSELQLTTQLLLTALPSSTHFLLLPSSIKSYTPYVDLTSPSSSFPQNLLAKRTGEWFEKSIQELSHSFETWFSCLQSMTEAWKLRSWSRTWVSDVVGLHEQERDHIANTVDDVCRRQLASIWRASFNTAIESFTKELNLAVEAGGKSADGLSSLSFLLRAPTLPLQSLANFGPSQANAALRKYKSALRHQVNNRTPLLEQVLKPVQSCATSLNKDLNSLKTGDEATQSLIRRLLTEYRPDAEQFCSDFLAALESVVDKVVKDIECPVTTLIFVSNLAEEVSTRSGFVHELDCEELVTEAFGEKILALHDRITDRWRVQTISRISQEYSRMCPVRKSSTEDPSIPSPNHISALIKSLLALSTALQELGSNLESPRRDEMARETLYRFIETLVDGDEDSTSNAGHRWNLLFLQKLYSAWDPHWLEMDGNLEVRMREMAVSPDAGTDITAHLAGTQTLLASLLPNVKVESTPTGKVDKTVVFLRHGVPSATGSDSHPTVDVVKPSSRFGLLLVGSTVNVR